MKNHENILFVFGSAIGSKVTQSKINVHCKFLQLLPYNFYFTNFLKRNISDKVDKEIYSKIIVELNDYYESNSWNECKEILNYIFKTYNFKQVYSAFYPCTKNNNIIGFINNILSDEKPDNYMMNMQMIKYMLKRVFIPIYAAEKLNIKVKQFVDDPLEYYYQHENIERFSFHDHLENAKYLPWIEYGIFKNSKVQYKKYDFTFGIQDLEDYQLSNIRHQLACELNELSNQQKEYNIYIKSKSLNLNNIIAKDIYDDQIASSYSTLIAPAICDEVYSYCRFIESIANNCIPIFYVRNANERSLDVLNRTFRHKQDFLHVIKRYCLYTKNANELPILIDGIKRNYRNILIDFIMTNNYRQLNSRNYYNQKFKEAGLM